MIYVSVDCFDLNKIVDPADMQRYTAFHLGLHCLKTYSLRVSRLQRRNMFESSQEILIIIAYANGNSYKMHAKLLNTSFPEPFSMSIFMYTCTSREDSVETAQMRRLD